MNHVPDTTEPTRLSRWLCASIRVCGGTDRRIVYTPVVIGSPARTVLRMPATPELPAPGTFFSSPEISAGVYRTAIGGRADGTLRNLTSAGITWSGASSISQ